MDTGTDQEIKVVVVAPEPERCDLGKKLIKAWVRAYNERANYANWQDFFFKGYMPYHNHAASCPQCLEYTLSRRAQS